MFQATTDDVRTLETIRTPARYLPPPSAHAADDVFARDALRSDLLRRMGAQR